MKKKHLRTLLALILTCGVLLSLGAPASAAVQPRYANISTFTASLDITSSGASSNYAKIKLYSPSYSADVTMELQRQIGNTWTTVKSWSAAGRISVSIEQQWFVVKGYDYRVLATANIYDANGNLIETASVASTEVSY